MRSSQTKWFGILYSLPCVDIFCTDDHLSCQIPRVSDAVHELILQQDVLICYWCLRLLQCFLGARTPNTATDVNASEDQRAKLIQHLVHHGTLQHAIVDLIPASFAASNASSFISTSSAIGTAFWTIDPEAVRSPPVSLSSTQSSMLCTKEARVQNEINVVFYETLLTLHHLLMYQPRSKRMHLQISYWKSIASLWTPSSMSGLYAWQKRRWRL